MSDPKFACDHNRATPTNMPTTLFSCAMMKYCMICKKKIRWMKKTNKSCTYEQIVNKKREEENIT
jgi:hypothetical protein